MDKVSENMKGKKCDKEVDNSSESSDKYVKGIHFDDGEEERMNGFDEGVDEDQPRGTSLINGDAKSEPLKESFITQDIGREHIIEEDYMTDELDSGEDDDICDERPSVTRFNEKYALSKDFIFKAIIKFSSLKQFKNAILDHNVLNGMDVRFEKMIQIGVRLFVRKKNYVATLSYAVEF